ncbi:MAG: LON peptidase substrate-binding domain-containing protein [Bryobacteraceae bacterium]
MQHDLLPLFPLQVVLLPGSPLPLHIFEDRYKEMMGEIISSRGEFGVVLAADDGIVNTGCTAVVENVVKRYPDGGLDIVASGRRRFEIVLLNEEKTYLRGSVQFFDDEVPESESADPVFKDARRRALAGYDELRLLDSSEPLAGPALENPQLSFQLARAVPDLGVRQVLLNTRSETLRLRLLADFFPKFLTRQRRISHLRSVAPTNGHAKVPDEL